jgi:3-methyladenine DNA glycosylase AlkD
MGTDLFFAAGLPGTRTEPDAKNRSVPFVLAWLKKHSSKAARDGMSRYAIPNDKALGVKMGDIQKLARLLGRSHELALELWKTDVYEARMLCAYVDEIERVTPKLMDAQARDFDNWAICDTLCFALWVRSPHAFRQIRKWAGSRDEYVKRAAFALLASVSLRGKGKHIDDADILACLPLIEKAATDERNFVKKGVNWALRGIGRRSPALRKAATALARKLAASDEAAPRWIGKDALREFAKTNGKRKRGHV